MDGIGKVPGESRPGFPNRCARRTGVLLRAVLLFACAGAAFADRIVLKDGRTYEGEVLEETADRIRIKTAKATLTFGRDQVESIERGESPSVARTKRLEALDPAQPAGYLEMARWLAAAPADLQDEPILRRVCSAAAFLEPSQAAEAQYLLGQVLLSKDRKQAAAEAFSRALAGDPKHARAKEQLEALVPVIQDSCRQGLEKLQKALSAARDARYGDAIPLLREAAHVYYSGKCRDFTGMSLTQLADDFQKRVPCLACKGAKLKPCPTCNGAGVLSCTRCAGKGVRKTPQEKPTFAQEICTVCFHTGTLLCGDCDAERFLTVTFKEPVEGRRTVDVATTPGRERAQLGKVCSTTTWLKDGVEVLAISAGRLTRGGTLVCRTCRGIPFNPPPTPVPAEGIRAYLEKIEGQIKGTIKIEPVLPADQAWEEEEVQGAKFRWESGKWK